MFQCMEDLPMLTPDPLFDEYGDYRNIVAISQVLMSHPVIETQHITDLPTLIQLYSQEVKPRQIDYGQFITKLAYLPVDIIKKNL